MHKLVRAGLVVMFVCAVALASLGQVFADTKIYEDLDWTTITSSSGTSLGTHYLKATVWQLDSNLYKYEYLVDFASSLTLSKFRLANSLKLPFLLDGYAPGNDHTANFTNPGASQIGGGIMEWASTGTVMQGPQQARFWFYSNYSYKTNVTVTLYGGSAQLSQGKTVGMVPEPASAMGLGFGLFGVAGAFLRKLRQK